ncbi:glycosyltransferase [Bacillus sp. ISL-51]|uniref:glycosyltransferase n=1 Tax=Bacteria TaxID=2 RepID=UPI001BE7985F|nr:MULTISPECIES: glycosyltransferase [Bacteria]MBT2572768.1 glycosyltransferase [Bacillus sp. ISL-51]MBT2713240.1 glycosyltransferase [Pseudomonas sp. ISL-88]
MTAPLVSIIVPMYRTEPFIRECAASLMKQTLTSVEIIFVNDGSPDQSGRIAEELAAQDARIQVIHKENGGLSSARNAGIKAARGRYIGFVDGDDYVSDTMFERLYEEAEKERLDIAGCGFYKETPLKERTYVRPPLPAGRIFTKADMTDQLTRAHELRFIWYVWRYIYRRDALNGLLFDEEIRFAEDSPFNLAAFRKAARVKVIDEGLYIYRENPQSLTEIPFKPHLDEQLQKQYEAKMAFYEVNGLTEACRTDIDTYLCKHQIPMLLANACASPQPSHEITDHIRRILSYDMVKAAVRNTPCRHKQLLTGERVVLGLCKMRLPILLQAFFERKTKEKGSAEGA